MKIVLQIVQVAGDVVLHYMAEGLNMQHHYSGTTTAVLEQMRDKQMDTETHYELVVHWTLHQALDERMGRETWEGDMVFRSIAQLCEYMPQVLQAKQEEKGIQWGKYKMGP